MTQQRIGAAAILRLRQLLSLAGDERKMLLLAFPLVAIARLVLWIVPSAVSVRILRRLGERAVRARHDDSPSVDRIVWAIEAASRRIPHATCLTQAVVGQLLLRHYGHDSRLCLGVARTQKGEFAAHAWLECEGRKVIGGQQSTGFSRLPELSTTVPQASRAGTPS